MSLVDEDVRAACDDDLDRGKTSQENLDILKHLINRQNPLHNLRAQFFTLKIKEGEAASVFLKRTKKAADHAMVDKMKKDDMVYHMVVAQCETYFKDLRTTILSGPINTLVKMEELIYNAERIKKIEEEMDEKPKDKGRKATTAGATGDKTPPRSRSNSRSNMSKITCFKCDLKGHYSRDCKTGAQNVRKAHI